MHGVHHTAERDLVVPRCTATQPKQCCRDCCRELGRCCCEIGNNMKALALLLGCTGTAGSAHAQLYFTLSIALSLSIFFVQTMSHCVQHKDDLLICFHYNGFVMQLSFPFPFSLHYLVLSTVKSFYCPVIYVLKAPKWCLFRLGHP